MARFGEAMRLDGRCNGQQIVPKAVVDDIRAGGRRADFDKGGFATLPGWSYRDLWWVSHNEHGAFAARGVHGQAIYIEPKAERVIARFDPTSLSAFHALARHLMR
jgi:CubicO group peptidase (beta-lactamase class C family)